MSPNSIRDYPMGAPTIIQRKTPPVVIGLPTNSRIAEDLAPLRDALRLEGTQGILRSPSIRGAIFRTLRANDIATLLLQSACGIKPTIELGILGQDTMIENIEKLDSSRPMEVLQIDAGDPVKMTVLVREEETFQKPRGTDDRNPEFLVTSYPQIAQWRVMDQLSAFLRQKKFTLKYPPNWRFRGDLVIKPVEGQVENLVRNQDFIRTIAGLDIVRSGNTAREFGLKPFGEPILVSKPALFAWSSSGLKGKRIADCIDAIKEKLAEAGIPFSPGKGLKIRSTLESWSPPSL